MKIFSGLYKNRVIQAPNGLSTRPTSGRLREALFNICQGNNEGSCFLDLFAGSGAMGLEALSRGAKSATFIDNSKESIRCIQANLQALGVEGKPEVIYADVFDAIEKLAKKNRSYDIIYADPPYELRSKGLQEVLTCSVRLIRLIDCLIDAGSPLLSEGGSLFLEDASNALPEGEALKHLSLKSSRKMGRSALQHYIRNTGSNAIQGL